MTKVHRSKCCKARILETQNAKGKILSQVCFKCDKPCKAKMVEEKFITNVESTACKDARCHAAGKCECFPFGLTEANLLKAAKAANAEQKDLVERAKLDRENRLIAQFEKYVEDYAFRLCSCNPAGKQSFIAAVCLKFRSIIRNQPLE